MYSSTSAASEASLEGQRKSDPHPLPWPKDWEFKSALLISSPWHVRGGSRKVVKYHPGTRHKVAGSLGHGKGNARARLSRPPRSGEKITTSGKRSVQAREGDGDGAGPERCKQADFSGCQSEGGRRVLESNAPSSTPIYSRLACVLKTSLSPSLPTARPACLVSSPVRTLKQVETSAHAVSRALRFRFPCRSSPSPSSSSLSRSQLRSAATTSSSFLSFFLIQSTRSSFTL